MTRIPGLFDETVFDQAIQEFLDKKETLADYFDDSQTENIFAYIPQQKTSLVFTPQPVVKTMVDTLADEDPEIFTYPVLYIIEPSWWQMSDGEAMALRQYLDKGGFVIVDDFKTEAWMGGRGWAQFADNMARVIPDARFVDLDVSHPIFHQFFDIVSLDIFPQAYNAGQPVFRGLFQDNDPAKPLRMFVAYNTDISQFWEWSHRGLRPVDDTNEAYKLGVNSVMYGLLH